jgi:hypothetical protein
MFITYLINEIDIKSESLEIIKYLKSKEHIIDQMASEIKNINWIPSLLNYRNKSFEETVLSQTPEEKRKEFITIYQKYYDLLSPEGSRFDH